MNELEKQIYETKIECLEEFKRELMQKLKNDDRTSIYINFLYVVDEIATQIINE
ncbi:MAG: hypothetical protein MJ197_09715 [Bacteroidales bacterium]|nr:hypothetical protein [Bacteroidales bacterium]